MRYDMDEYTISPRDRMRDGVEGIQISRKEHTTGVSWWVGVPRGPEWDERCAWAEKRMNPMSQQVPWPQGGVFKAC